MSNAAATAGRQRVRAVAPRRRLLASRRAQRLARVTASVLAGGLAVAAVAVAHDIHGIDRSAHSGEDALRDARRELSRGATGPARADLERARRSFEQARRDIRSPGPALAALRRVGVVDDQLHAMDALADAGGLAARAGLALAAAAPDARGRRSGALAGIRRLRAAIGAGLAIVRAAVARVDALGDVRLVSPLRARVDDAREQLAGARESAIEGRDTLSAMAILLGENGPRRYLVLSQNPAEARPTGGFIGTYGVLATRAGSVRLERYAPIERWYARRPRASVPADRAPGPLRVLGHPVRQTIANVNTTPDWQQAARLATRLWARGGERPVDGVVSFTPELLARALRVLGPIHVPGFRRAVAGRDVVDTLDYYTHRRHHARESARKRFVSALATQVVHRLEQRSGRWFALGAAVARGLDAREGMAWSRDAGVQRMLAARRWDGRLPAVGGDFFYDSEFQYASKNGRGVRRRFAHVVTLRADGSARIATTMTIANTRANGMGIHSYLTLYGPRGAVLRADSDPSLRSEPTLAGHPAAAWLRYTAPWGRTSLRTVWDVPRLLARRPDGRLAYHLSWLRVPAHAGDRLELDVRPPSGWRWAGTPPPRSVRLDRDLDATWLLAR